MKPLRISFLAGFLATFGAMGCSAPSSEGDDTSNGDDPSGTPKPGDPCTDCEPDPTRVCEQSVIGSPTLRRLTVHELNETLNDVFPEVEGTWTSALSSDPISELGFDNQSELLVVGKQQAREIDATALAVSTAVVGSLAAILPCASAADRACAELYLSSHGRRLFRRPLSADESSRYLAFFDQALAEVAFPEAIGWVTRALIHATPTLYRREIGEAAGEARDLSQYELATALAYTFAGTTPGTALLDLAEAGALATPEALVDIALQLLATPQGKEQVQRFFDGSLEFGRVTAITKTNVPEFEGLREQMRQETRTFIDQVIIERGGGLPELLTSPVTYPSLALAQFYGLPAPGADYAQVQRPTDLGVGILAQGSVLSSEASVNASSPTQRGLLVFEKLLCREPLIVPANVPEISAPLEGDLTTRQRYEELHATGACASCHTQFDPIGFAFEHFDEVGRYRADESGLAIDASGEIPGESPTVPVDGQIQLANALVSLPSVQACMSGHLKAYAFGTLTPCLAESKRSEFMDGAIGYLEYLASFAAEPHFRSRAN